MSVLRKLIATATHRANVFFTGESERTFFDLKAVELTAAPEDAAAVLRCYEARPDLRAAFPLGLTPAGRGEFLMWVLKHGGEVGVSAGGAMAALRTQDARRDRGLVHTYKVQPAWQAAHPHALTPAGWGAFRSWVAREYGCSGSWLRSAALPAPDADRPLSPDARGVNVIAPWRYVCGLREVAERLADGLESLGYAVGKRATPAPPVSPGDPPGGYLDRERYPITVVETGALEPFDPLFPACGLHPRDGVYRIAAWAWELADFPADALATATLANEFWALSEFAARGLRAVERERPVVVMPPGVVVPEFLPLPRRAFGLPTDATVFLFTFDLSGVLERKNPLGVIEAFRRAFAPTDAAHLVLKVNRAEAFAEDFEAIRAACADLNVTLLTGVMPRVELAALLAMSDSYVSLHRAEGFGFTVAEAMLMGKPVIATDCSATAEFLTADVGLPVRCREVELDRDYGPYRAGRRWAEPDLDHAAGWMRWVFDKREEAKQLGERARAFARERFDPTAAARRAAGRLEAILSGS